MDLSILDEKILEMDDSFLLSKPEAMDDEVTQILKKWNKTYNNLHPKKDVELSRTIDQNETFDSRTFTRPNKRRTIPTDTEPSPSLVPGSINLQVGGAMSDALMKRSWLNDVSPPSSIGTSMDFQNNDTMLNSLITSGDFSNVSFLLNGSEGNDMLQNINRAVNIDNVSPTKNLTRNLMDFTFDVRKSNALASDATFIADVTAPSPDLTNNSADDSRKNLTFNARANGGVNLTWDKIQDHQNQLNNTIVQSTPVHNHPSDELLRKNFNHTMSPISSMQADGDDDDTPEVIIRNVRGRNLVNDITIDDYRNSMEDQCEFLLNEETIKLSSRVCGDSFETLDLKTALIQSADANEKDFDEILDSFNVKKSLESEKLLQSVDNIKQRHSLINFEKQREEKQKKDEDYDNKTQYDSMNKSSERLLRRSRLYDDVNLILQQQIDTNTSSSSIKSAKASEFDQPQETEADEVIDKSNRDRFKTIKLNKRLQSGMVVVDDEAESTQVKDGSSTSPGTNKERRNQLNQQKQEQEDVEFKKPAPAPSKMSTFGFSRPSYRSRNDLNLPLKASSTDSLDDEPRLSNLGSQIKSPMGIKSKSIHNLMFGGQGGNRMGSYSNLKLVPGAARSQSNLKTPRTSSLVRPAADTYKAPSSSYGQSSQARAPTSRKTSLVRPSSAYYGNTFTTKRTDSDNESGCSLSSSSASSRNSVLSGVVDHQQFYQQHSQQGTEVPSQTANRVAVTGTIPKPSGLRPPSNLRAPQARSGLLPRPSGVVRR